MGKEPIATSNDRVNFLGCKLTVGVEGEPARIKAKIEVRVPHEPFLHGGAQQGVHEPFVGCRHFPLLVEHFPFGLNISVKQVVEEPFLDQPNIANIKFMGRRTTLR